MSSAVEQIGTSIQLIDEAIRTYGTITPDTDYHRFRTPLQTAQRLLAAEHQLDVEVRDEHFEPPEGRPEVVSSFIITALGKKIPRSEYQPVPQAAVGAHGFAVNNRGSQKTISSWWQTDHRADSKGSACAYLSDDMQGVWPVLGADVFNFMSDDEVISATVRYDDQSGAFDQARAQMSRPLQRLLTQFFGRRTMDVGELAEKSRGLSLTRNFSRRQHAGSLRPNHLVSLAPERMSLEEVSSLPVLMLSHIVELVERPTTPHVITDTYTSSAYDEDQASQTVLTLSVKRHIAGAQVSATDKQALLGPDDTRYAVPVAVSVETKTKYQDPEVEGTLVTAFGFDELADALQPIATAAHEYIRNGRRHKAGS